MNLCVCLSVPKIVHCKISWSNDDFERFLKSGHFEPPPMNLSGPSGPWQIGLTKLSWDKPKWATKKRHHVLLNKQEQLRSNQLGPYDSWWFPSLGSSLGFLRFSGYSHNLSHFAKLFQQLFTPEPKARLTSNQAVNSSLFVVKRWHRTHLFSLEEYVNVQSSLHLNVIFFLCARMGNAACIIFIMWSSISLLNTW